MKIRVARLALVLGFLIFAVIPLVSAARVDPQATNRWYEIDGAADQLTGTTLYYRWSRLHPTGSEVCNLRAEARGDDDHARVTAICRGIDWLGPVPSLSVKWERNRNGEKLDACKKRLTPQSDGSGRAICALKY